MLSRELEVYNQLRQMIFRYELIPGQKLQYQDLADKLQVSRTPVKNALNLLESEGLVRLSRNKGYYVSELSKEEAENLFELREILEVEAARLAARRYTPEGFKVLVSKNEEYIRAVEHELTRGRFFIDMDFHLQVAIMSENMALHKHLKQVIVITFLKHRIDRLSTARGFQVRREHDDIVQAIREQNEELAAKSVRYHIQRHRENILSIL